MKAFMQVATDLFPSIYMEFISLDHIVDLVNKMCQLPPLFVCMTLIQRFLAKQNCKCYFGDSQLLLMANNTYFRFFSKVQLAYGVMLMYNTKKLF